MAAGGEGSVETSRLDAALYAVELREGVFTSAGRRVYFQDKQTLRDAADLYAVLKESADTGSPNVENDLARSFLEILQAGQGLSDTQLGKLLEMLKRHAGALRDYRASSDPTRNILDVPDAATAKIVS